MLTENRKPTVRDRIPSRRRRPGQLDPCWTVPFDRRVPLWPGASGAYRCHLRWRSKKIWCAYVPAVRGRSLIVVARAWGGDHGVDVGAAVAAVLGAVGGVDMVVEAVVGVGERHVLVHPAGLDAAVAAFPGAAEPGAAG